jgi:hypothetical protein
MALGGFFYFMSYAKVWTGNFSHILRIRNSLQGTKVKMISQAQNTSLHDSAIDFSMQLVVSANQAENGMQTTYKDIRVLMGERFRLQPLTPA